MSAISRSSSTRWRLFGSASAPRATKVARLSLGSIVVASKPTLTLPPPSPPSLSSCGITSIDTETYSKVCEVLPTSRPACFSFLASSMLSLMNHLSSTSKESTFLLLGPEASQVEVA